ncbi:hypothetical protein Lpar_0811 [Legionella parisiensis]|uniref:Uncharacterized protein n=3 Tax=Legionella parisiensis TaxID=45071 RepID=A0A1E5JM37_9GAMM|nr:hypothetical protein Lpar_0811 [Legionella parisiensis]OEH45540.1 hypothetical protein lpari_03450 [Legionella parisiensis]STX78092.1 Uncharacterised protein [Legionella parisiensis]
MTHAPQKTLGDPSSAAKLQRLLQEQFKQLGQEIDVKVIVDTGSTEDEEAVKNLFHGEMSYELIKKFNTPEGKKSLEQNISDADLIILYPTPHFLNLNTATLISDIMARSKKSGVISLVEYDYDILHQHNSKGFVNTVAGSMYVSTGIGEKCLGIFINHPLPSQENLFQRLHLTDLAKLPRDLNQNEGLYFGYFNKIGCSKTGANPAHFIAFAAHNSPGKQVDVVIPLLPGGNDIDVENKIDALLEKNFMDDIKDFNKVVITYSHAGTTRYFVYQKNETQLVAKEINEVEYETQKNDSDKVIRVFNPFPLHPQSVQALMEASESVNLLTGDQSLSEALSLAKIPFYQAMPWKKKLYDSLTSFTQSYPTLHEWLTKNASQTISPKELAEFYSINKSKMQVEIQSLRAELILKKNLAINIIDYINSLIGMSLLERYQYFIQNLINDFDFYTQSEGRQKEKFLSHKALCSHIEFYLKSADTDDERNAMIECLINNIHEIFDLEVYDVMPFFYEIHKQYPSLNIQLPAPIILNSLQKTTSQEVGIVLINRKEEDITIEAHPINDYLNSLSWIDTNILTSEEKKEALDVMLSLSAFFYEEKPRKDMLIPLLQIMENESDEYILQQGLKILFTIPTYEISGEVFEFTAEEPSVFFQLKEQERTEVLSRILNNPQAKEILLEELFKAENPPCIDALNKEPINTLVLRALFFEKATSDNSHSFFKPQSKENELKESLLIQLLETTDQSMQKAIQNQLLAISAENTGMHVPNYLSAVLSKKIENVM